MPVFDTDIMEIRARFISAFRLHSETHALRTSNLVYDAELAGLDDTYAARIARIQRCSNRNLAIELYFS